MNTIRYTLFKKNLFLASLLTVVAFSATSSAQERDTLLVTQPFATELSAVTAAANRFNPDSVNKDREYMGVILKKEGLYYYTYTSGEKGHDTVTTLLPAKSFGDTVALWHTHGRKSYIHRYFSPSDTQLANRLQLPFYLADYTGKLKVFQPGAKTLPLLSAKHLGFYARGAATGELVKNHAGNTVTVAVKERPHSQQHTEVILAHLPKNKAESAVENI